MMHYGNPAGGSELDLLMIYLEEREIPQAGPEFLGGMDGFYRLKVALKSAEIWAMEHGKSAPDATRYRSALDSRAHDEQGRHHFREALADLLACRRLNPTGDLLKIASLQLYLGNESDSLATCQEAMRERFAPAGTSSQNAERAIDGWILRLM